MKKNSGPLSGPLKTHMDSLKEWFTPWTPKKTLLTLLAISVALILLFVILTYRYVLNDL